MAQASLLLQLKIPTNEDDKRKWSERMRSQITKLSKTILELESQKQQLLARLAEADEIEADVDEPMDSLEPAVLPHPSPGLSPARDSSIIDLLSQESVTENRSRTFTGQVHSGPNALLESSENACPNLSGSDIRPDPAPSTTEVRVYRPEEFDMIDWSKLSVPELKEWASFFGMKSSGGRQLLLSELQKIFKYLRNELIVPGELPALQFDKQEIFKQLSVSLRSNVFLYERVLVFESLEFDELFTYFKSSFSQDGGGRLPPNFKGLVREFLDEHHVQFNTTTENIRKTRNKPKINSHD